MSGGGKKKGTGTPNFGDVLKGLQSMNSGGLLSSVGAGASSTSAPGVPASQAGDQVVWQGAGQSGALSLPADLQKLITTDAAGNAQSTYGNLMQLLHEAGGDRGLLVEIQNDLKAAGYISASSKVAFGTLDTPTIDAWKRMVTDAIGTQTPVTKLLTTNASATSYVPELYAYQSKYQSAVDASAAVSTPSVSLTDPNQIAQAFASAMEADGQGAPSKKAVAKFVDAFHQAEVNAVRDQVTAAKQGDAAGAKLDFAQLQALQNEPQAPQGTPIETAQRKYGDTTTSMVSPAAQDAYNAQMGAFDTTMNATGPTIVATKSMPNLDAEAMAAAKSADPAQYYATMASYVGNTIHSMLGGDLTGQSTPTAPSQTAPGGAILTAPVGAM